MVGLQPGHLAISDPTGGLRPSSEYIGGKLFIHHGRNYQVMTNSPVFDKQLALNEYWQEITAVRPFLPGTQPGIGPFRSVQHFILTLYPKTTDMLQAVAKVVVWSDSWCFCSARGITTPGQPNIASTLPGGSILRP